MSNYKLTAIYKQKVRCKLRKSDCTTYCLCCHCWVGYKRQQISIKTHFKMQNPPLPEFSKVIVYDEEKCRIPLPPVPPPLPVLVASEGEKENSLQIVKAEPIEEEEIKRLWSSRIRNTADDKELPTQFVFVKLEPILQVGPNCGLAALAMATTATPTPVTMDDLFIRAKKRGFTHQGEMFSVQNMALLAQTVLRPWFKVELVTGGFTTNLSYVMKSLREGGLMLVPYDASGNYSPCTKNGHKSHWAVICGAADAYSSDVDSCYVFARQGKSRRLALWPFNDVQVSNDNLFEFDPKRAEDGSQYVLPDGGVEAGLLGQAVLLHSLHKEPDLRAFP